MAKRSLPTSPSNGYAPASVDCPPIRPTIRKADGLSAQEVSWLQHRRKKTTKPLINWLKRASIADFDVSSYIKSLINDSIDIPNVAIAFSGGGYRSLMNGAGFLAAADSRTKDATNAGHIGGLLQSTTYMAGLSGGGWLVGSIYANNFSTVEKLQMGSSNSSVWQFQNSIFEGPDGQYTRIIDTAEYIKTIKNNVQSKQKAGFNISVTDFWGRALSFQLVDAKDGGPSHTFSSISLQPDFQDGLIPFPILVAINRKPGNNVVSINSTVVEMNPYELGSWDSRAAVFAPMTYVGSDFISGSVPVGGKCVQGFDQVGFIMGTSSTLFNQIIMRIGGGVPQFLREAVLDLSNSDNDVAQYQPNPFYGFDSSVNENSESSEIPLVDGGEDGQNIPLWPLLQPERRVDVIFAIDSSADTSDNWPNGTSLVATYERSLDKTISNDISFPPVPDQNTFVNLGLNKSPTFFGCNASNTTNETPLIIYIPNSNYITHSNVSTFQAKYDKNQRDLIIRNGYDVATLANGTNDSQWHTCIGCAVLSRSFIRSRIGIPSACQACFQHYCWDGKRDSRDLSNHAERKKSKGWRSKVNILPLALIIFCLLPFLVMS